MLSNLMEGSLLTVTFTPARNHGKLNRLLLLCATLGCRLAGLYISIRVVMTAFAQGSFL